MSGTSETLDTNAKLSSVDVVSGLGLIPHPEGGFFLETWRSGCEPMTTMGQTGYECAPVSLVEENGERRSIRRPDKNSLRNSLTSIYWMPTSASPRLWLAVNLSDHVHYYHGGSPFDYVLVEDGVLHRVTLGPEFTNGQKMQVAVKGGTWKAGLLRRGGADYCLIGEAVAPGFDFHDFTWVSADEVKKVRAGLARSEATSCWRELVYGMATYDCEGRNDELREQAQEMATYDGESLRSLLRSSLAPTHLVAAGLEPSKGPTPLHQGAGGGRRRGHRRHQRVLLRQRLEGKEEGRQTFKNLKKNLFLCIS